MEESEGLIEERLKLKLEDWDTGLLYATSGVIDFHDRTATISEAHIINFGNDSAYNTKIRCKIWDNDNVIGVKTINYGRVPRHDLEEFIINLDVSYAPTTYKWNCFVDTCENCRILANLLE